MAKYLQYGGKYYTAGDRGQLQEVSERDIVGRRGTGGSIDLVRQEGDILDVQPGQLTLGPNNAVLYGGRQLALGGSSVFSNTLPETGAIPVNQDFTQYLQQTGQTYNNGQFSGSPSVPSPNTAPAVSTVQSVQNALNKIYDAGYKINPNAQITPKSLDEFLTIAQKEIDPYYLTQIKLASDDLKKSLGYSQEQILQSEKDLEQRYGRSLQNIGQQSAETGLALSGQRQLQERQLAKETQQAIDEGRRQLGYQANQAVGQFTRKFAGLPGFQLPNTTLTEAPRVLTAQSSFEQTGRQLPYYELSPETYAGLTGEETFARQAALQNRAYNLEEAQRLGQSLPLRTLPNL